MKNTFLLLCASILLSLGASAQKKNTTVKAIKVPETVNSSFQSQYTLVENNKWSKNLSGNYVASFINADQSKQTAEFDEQGRMVKSQIVFSSEAYPEVLTTALAAKPKYAQARITDATRIDIAGIAPYYKVKVENGGQTTRELFVSEGGLIME